MHLSKKRSGRITTDGLSPKQPFKPFKLYSAVRPRLSGPPVYLSITDIFTKWTEAFGMKNS